MGEVQVEPSTIISSSETVTHSEGDGNYTTETVITEQRIEGEAALENFSEVVSENTEAEWETPTSSTTEIITTPTIPTTMEAIRETTEAALVAQTLGDLAINTQLQRIADLTAEALAEIRAMKSQPLASVTDSLAEPEAEPEAVTVAVSQNEPEGVAEPEAEKREAARPAKKPRKRSIRNLINRKK